MIQRGTDFGFIGTAYQAPMTLQDAEDAINYYVEVGEAGEDKMPVALLGAPGLNQVATAATGTLPLYTGTLTPANGANGSVGLTQGGYATLYSGTLTAGQNQVPQVGFNVGSGPIPPTTLYNGTFQAVTINANSVGFDGTGATPPTDANGYTLGAVIDSTGSRGSPTPFFKVQIASSVQLSASYFASLTLSGPQTSGSSTTLQSSAATFNSVNNSGAFTATWIWSGDLGLVAGSGYTLTYQNSGSAGSGGIGSISPGAVGGNSFLTVADSYGNGSSFTLALTGTLTQSLFQQLSIVGSGLNVTLAATTAGFSTSGGNSYWSWGAASGMANGGTYALTLQTATGNVGSITPATDSLGNTIAYLYQSAGTVTLQLQSSADLGQSYFTSFSLNGVSFLSTSASYTYSSGLSTNTWVWNGSAGLVAGTNAAVNYSVSTGSVAPVRGSWVLPGGSQALVVCGNVCYLMSGNPGSALGSASFTLSPVGVLNTSSGAVCIRDNGSIFGGLGGFAFIVDGSSCYFYNIATNGSGSSQVQFSGGVSAGSALITLPGDLPNGLLMSSGATLSDLSGFIPAGTYIASVNYSAPSLTMSANALNTNASETITLTIPAFGQISDPGFLGATRIGFIEGWLMFSQPNTRTFFTTGPTPYQMLFPGSWYALKDSSSDNLVTLFENNRELWLIGERTSEVWYNAGNSEGVAFSRIPAVGPQIGCSAMHSITRVGPSLIWLAQNEQGQNMVVMTNQYSWERVSTHAVDNAIASYAVVNDAIGYAYEEDGHLFYMLTFPTADASWCYDLTASQNLGKACWHKRLSLDSNGIYHRHRSNCFMNFMNTRLVGDFENGAIYEMSRSYYTDNGATLKAVRRAPHVWSKANRKRVYHGWLQIEFTPGVGLQSGQGANPLAVLRWSNDGGFTWSHDHPQSMGRAGQTLNRCIWRRLGTARDRVYEVSVTDPVNRDIVGVTLFFEPEAE